MASLSSSYPQTLPPSYSELFAVQENNNQLSVSRPSAPFSNELQQPPSFPSTLGYVDNDSQVPTESNLPPPEYEQAAQDLPPSYDTVFGRVRLMRQQSVGHHDFFKQTYNVLRETFGCTLFLGVLLAIPVAMIVVGSLHIYDCPAERYIPIYLVVMGTCVTVKIVMELLQSYKFDWRNECSFVKQDPPKRHPFEVFLIMFMLGWFITGNVWIYKTHTRFSTDPTSVNYCSPAVFYLAFWLTNSIYVLIVLCICCLYGVSMAAKDNES
ncbi:transmembrane protein 272-like [Gigantopelta aegis]|uniref:transmembrane protein 272-like n=1 Tax=Gigantopelta aegis TaxID=1735272 RepID=UPI001B88BC6A|nr:transmembrane protein 272-like [Gigantopelta aegis]